MAKVLILESDPVRAAVLEDRLHVNGHRAEIFAAADQAIERACEGEAALIILEMENPDRPGLEIIQALRGRDESRTLPILALTSKNDSQARVAALRAGADELLTRPIDLEELLIRAERLLGQRGTFPAVMQGDLSNHPTWGLIQYIQQAEKSCKLIVRGQRGAGQLQTRNGQVVSARFGSLRSHDALLALLELKEGHFRLTTGSTAEEDDDETEIPPFLIPEVLMHGAWLDDQLRRRAEFLPATGLALEATGGELPEIEDEMASVPIVEVLDQIRADPGVRLFDLISRSDHAPAKVRLAAAWLAEHGLAGPSESAKHQTLLSTGEISSSMVLEIAIHNLLAAAREHGFGDGELPYLVLVGRSRWPQLRELLENVPGFKRIEALRNLVNQVDRRGGGSASFDTEYGTLTLHLQIFEPEVGPQISAIVSVCAGVLLWLGPDLESDSVQQIFQRLQTQHSSTLGVLVAPRAEDQELARGLAADSFRWRVSNHEPQSLIGILRLLHPRGAG